MKALEEEKKADKLLGRIYGGIFVLFEGFSDLGVMRQNYFRTDNYDVLVVIRYIILLTRKHLNSIIYLSKASYNFTSLSCNSRTFEVNSSKYDWV